MNLSTKVLDFASLVDPAACRRNNAHVISEQGKPPPDFVLEIASLPTGRIDVMEKRRDYAALGLGNTDSSTRRTGNGKRLAREWLMEGEYVAVDIEKLPDENLQGYSPVLNLHIRWEGGELHFHEPAMGCRIATFIYAAVDVSPPHLPKCCHHEVRFRGTLAHL